MFQLLQKSQAELESLLATKDVSMLAQCWHRVLSTTLLVICLLASSIQASFSQCPTITFPDSIPPMVSHEDYSASVAVSPPGTYTYSVVGYFPAGLSLNSLTGMITGMPTFTYDASEFTVRAVIGDSCTAEKTYEYYIAPKPDTIPFPKSLPKGQVGHAYYASISPGEQYGYYYYPNFSVPGLTFNEVGELAGIPTTAGSYPVKVFARSFNGYQEYSLTFTLVIQEGNCPTVTLPVSTSIPGITYGQAYSVSFAASPTSSYTYSYTTSHTEDIPGGLTFNTSTGELSGNVEPNSTGFFITVQATDTNSCAYRESYYIGVNCPLVLPDLPNGKVGEYYSANVTPDKELGPYSYYIADGGILPPGLTFNTTTGEITGTPTLADNYFFTIIVQSPCQTYKAYALTIAPATSCPASGYVMRETWVKVKGYDVRQIPVNTPPTATRRLTSFEGPSNVTNEYGDRIRGYIHPPVSGNYVFWISSDDNSALFISSDEQSAHKQRIAWVNGSTPPREWNLYSTQQSAPIYLEAGKQYYIESLHKEAYGNDHIAVGWQLPTGAIDRPISCQYLSPFIESASHLAVLPEELLADRLISVASLRAAPNPFSDQTTIHFKAMTSGKASVAAYDLNGSLIKVIFEGELEAGETKELIVEGAALPSGVYWVKAFSASELSYLKLVLTK